MNPLGHGIDLVQISRIKQILQKDGTQFVDRVFSEQEQKYCNRFQDPYPHYAARFAAKEAYGKALGLGLGKSGDLVEVEVELNDLGAPSLVLKGRAADIAQQKKIKKILLSLSHDADMAIASVILYS
ncbi:MAG: holo-ACP synthase [Oligoflexia bacterium]|nr:holo-ACP synthase [Oligoflexia bacterium]